MDSPHNQKHAVPESLRVFYFIYLNCCGFVSLISNVLDLEGTFFSFYLVFKFLSPGIKIKLNK